MSTLGKAIILFGADTALFRGDVGRAVAIFSSGIGQMQKVALGFKSTIAGSITLGSIALIGKQSIDNADALGKMTQKTGIATEALSGLQHAAKLGNVEQSQFNKGLIEFTKSLVAASNEASKEGRVLRALGVDIKAGPHEAFLQFADGISKVGTEELKTAAATAVLKKAGADWIPTLNEGRQGLKEAADEAQRLGLIVSEDFARQAAQFQDNMTRIAGAGRGLANAFMQGGALAILDDFAKRAEKGAEKGNFFLGVLEALRNFDAVTGAFLSPNDPLFQRRLEELNPDLARGSAIAGGQLVRGKIIGGPIGGGAIAHPAGAFKPSDEELRRALVDNDALQKRQIAALQSMEEKKKVLFNLNEQELMQERVRTGTYKDFEPAVKARLMGLAREIDLRKQLIDRIDLETERVKALHGQRERGDDILRDFAESGRVNVEQLEFETDLIGRTTDEQEKLNALRQIDIDLLNRKRQAAEAYGDNVAGLMVEVARLDQAAEQQRQAVLSGLGHGQQVRRDEGMRQRIEGIQFETQLLGMNRREVEKLVALRELDIQQFGRILTETERSILLNERDLELRRKMIEAIEERQRVERDWLTGAKQGLEEYADAATDAAANTRAVFMTTFRELENAGVRLVRGQKVNAREFVDAILDDIARALVRQLITGPIAEAIKSVFNLGGGAGGLAGLEASAAMTSATMIELDATLIALDATTLSLEAAFIQATAAAETFAAGASASAASASAGSGASGLSGMGGLGGMGGFGGSGGIGGAGMFSNPYTALAALAISTIAGGEEGPSIHNFGQRIFGKKRNDFLDPIGAVLSGDSKLEDVLHNNIFASLAGNPFALKNLFAGGGIMTARGMLPLSKFDRGGVALANHPQVAIFGEGGMNEAFVPLPDGRRIPVALEGGRGQGSQYFIDARGADRGGLQRLEEMIQRLDGSIEHRAVSAAVGASMRGGRAGRALRGS